MQETDQRIVLHGVTWKDYVIVREVLDSPGLRMTYLEGTLEIRSPSPRHETAKSRLLPALDLEVLARFAAREDQHEAVKAYRDLLRG
jgi:hypothetical protein